MLFNGIPGYFVEPTGELSCLDCSVDFILEHNYVPTEETAEMSNILSRSQFTKVRRWVSDTNDDMWMADLGEEA